MNTLENMGMAAGHHAAMPGNAGGTQGEHEMSETTRADNERRLNENLMVISINGACELSRDGKKLRDAVMEMDMEQQDAVERAVQKTLDQHHEEMTNLQIRVMTDLGQNVREALRRETGGVPEEEDAGR